MARKIKDLPIGALVKDLDTKYYEKPIVWKIADKNHSGYPSNTVTLISDKILSIKAFDARESRNNDGNRRSEGNNRYKYSNLLQWLNSGSSNWYSAQHGADASPNSSSVVVGWNPYDSEPGFLYNFSSDFKNAMVSTNLKTARHSLDGGGSENVTSKIFLASTTEVGLDSENGIAEGTRFPIFDGNDSRNAYPTSEAVNKSDYTVPSLNVSTPWWWWLRTPYKYYSFYVHIVYNGGSLYWNAACNGDRGVRPLCNIKDDILVSDSPNSDGVYTIVWNQPPTKPSSIEIPTKIVATQNLNISWSRSSDPDNDTITYILERKLNSNNYTQIYSGGSITYTDRINKGYSKVRYRVKARDSVNNESDWIYSVERNIINNSTPTISSETSENLGTKTSGFSINYSVDDEDNNQTLRVYEYLDGSELKSFTATKKQTNAISISEDNFIKILNGNHKIKIKVIDSEGAFAEKTFTFTKNETQIHLELKTPLQADDIITKATLTVNRAIPNGAVFKVEICNNGFDSSPVWQDVTKQVIENKKIFISNKKKTASKWGLNVRITVNRNGASGDCFINGLGGAFE